jgi:glycosyltransferase involved in cell wall biosynthesis
MRLLVNAVGLRAGGGLTVGLNCLRGIRDARPDYQMMALVPAACGYEELCGELSIPYKAFRRTARYPAWRLWFDQVQAPLHAREWSADVLFTMNNQAAWAAPCRQILLFQNPYYIYPAAEWWSLVTSFERVSLLLQRALFGAIARRCACIAVQTDVASRRLQQQYGVDPERLTIIPNAIALEHDGAETAAGRLLARRMQEAASGRIGVLTLARYYPHKALEFIVRVAQRLRAMGDRRFVFFITVEADQHPGARALLEALDREQLAAEVVNLGPLGYGVLRSAYGAARISFLPSVLESMSGTHLEALHYQVPIVTTDRDFARHACGDAAEYFPPGDVDAAIERLRHVAESPVRAQDMQAAPRPRPWRDVCRDLGAIIDSVHRSERGMPEMIRARPL